MSSVSHNRRWRKQENESVKGFKGIETQQMADGNLKVMKNKGQF